MFHWILISVAFLFIAANILPFVRNSFWVFRILEYPRLQKLAIGILILIAMFFLRKEATDIFWVAAGLVFICCAYLCYKIFPYTVFAANEMKRADTSAQNGELKILTANVLEDNTEYKKLLQLVKTTDPDIIFLLETDEKWNEGVKELDEQYPHQLKAPIANTYGLLFFSRYVLRNEKIIFRVDEGVPSVEAEVQLSGGQWVKIFGLHPKPPVPGESLTATAKDKELMKVALLVEKEKLPCVVMGDLNDVAWSHTTELFRKVSGLLDPRRGRGFFSTFSANHWWVRFPLDYVFCSSDFGLVQMKRMPHFGSDHFAMFIHLQYQPHLEKVHEEPEADGEEKEEAKEKASEAVVE